MFLIYAPGHSVALPSEERGNTENMQASLVSHRTLSASVATYKRIDSKMARQYVFKKVKHVDYNKFITLILESAGRICVFTDSKGLTFKGVISPGDISLVSEKETGGVLFRDFNLSIKRAENV